MKNLSIIISLWFAVFSNSAFTQNSEWQYPTINQINRLPMRVNYFAYSNEQQAFEGKKEKSENFLSINGKWKFNFVSNADQRPKDYYTVDYNDRSWDLISACKKTLK